METLRILHGSEQLIEVPELTAGKRHNDFGMGFYCTVEQDLAGEWACRNNSNGYINSYSLAIDGLKVLDLLDGNYTALNWIAILLKNRVFNIDSPIEASARDYIINEFCIDADNYDVIIGYRADDSYFSYAAAWLENRISVAQLQRALVLGDLGEQIVLKSEAAFSNLSFIQAESVDANDYFPLFSARDNDARSKYKRSLETQKFRAENLYVLDFLREEIKSDDPRLQQYISARR